VLNTFDESALEAALRIKDAGGEEVRITVLTLGHKISKNVMLKALAPGADELIQVEDETFAPGNLDSHGTARALAAAIKKAGEVDLILVGREAADWNAGQVGIGLALELGLPVITLASTMEIHDGSLLAERALLDRHEKVRCRLPAVVMVSSEIGVLRYPSLPQIKAAKKKPAVAWGAGDIGFDAQAARNRIVVRRLYEPELRNRDCVMIEGDSPEETGDRLARRLRQDGIV
jgi:electron transfer flavoprotein beta subunit